MKRIVSAIVAGIAVALLGGAAPAVAAGHLVVSDPEEHAELQRAPGWVSLVFDAEVDDALAKLVVLNEAGQNVTVDALIIEGTQITTQLRSDLPKGTYTVLYRVNDTAGKPMGGSFQFAFGKGNWSPEGKSTWKGEGNEPPVIADPNPNPTGVPSGAPTTSAGPTATPTAMPSDTPSGTATSAPSPAVTSPADTPVAGGAWWPWVLGGVVVVAAGATAVVLWLRSRRS